jgi:hypothetical protein
VWKTLRIGILLLVLIGVAAHTWLDRTASTSWKQPLWVGIFPVNFDGSAAAERYIDSLTQNDFADIERFFQREAPRFGLSLDQPVHMELYPPSRQLPPAVARGAGPLGVAWWSLKLRWFASHAAVVPGRAPPRIRLFVLYHDPTQLQDVPDSHGMQKGLVGVVHAFADRTLAGTNDIIIAHELLHTVGATDKYAMGSDAPLFPDGFADPDQTPRFPQARAEIMAGRRALSETEFDMPSNLRDVVIGPATAAEIHWTSH